MKLFASDQTKYNFYRIFLAFFFLTLFARLYNFSESSSFSTQLALPLLRGIASDTAIVILFSVLLTFLPKSLYWLGTLLWCAILAGNSEHISFNSANVDLGLMRYGMQQNFIFGSVLTSSVLKYFIIYGALFGVFFILAGFIARETRVATYAPAFFLIALFLLLPLNRLYPGWIQANLIEENIQNILFKGHSKKIATPDTALSETLKELYYSTDLSGRPVAPYRQKPNIILVVVEALSEAHMQAGYTPYLKQLSEQNLYYPNFISTQRLTTNGIYTLWCGDYPNLLSMDTKSEVLLQQGFPDSCLPEILQQHGYATYFFQSAYIDYMDKNLLAKASGIELASGAETLGKGKLNGWGISDGQLFEATLNQLDAISKNPKPFFLTLLTVGTHHPYPGLPEAASRKYSNQTEAAFRYTDHLLQSFISALEKKGLLKNSLVLITNDESGFPLKPEQVPGGLLHGNHGFLIALTPQADKGVMTSFYSQRDILLSMLDYAGIPPGEGAYGRSIFRVYDTFRPMAFSNLYSRNAFALTGEGTLVSCAYGLQQCYKHFFEGSLFEASEFRTQEADLHDYQYIFNLAHMSDRKFGLEKIFLKEDLLLGSKVKHIYSERRHESRIGEEGIWQIKAESSKNNLNPVHFNLTVQKSSDPLKNSPKLLERDFILKPGEKLDFIFRVPYLENNIIFNSNLKVSIKGDDSLSLPLVSITSNPTSSLKPYIHESITR